jgi:hypothetical protein
VIRLLVSGYADSIERYSRHASLLNAAERAELLDPDFRLTGGVSSARGSRGALASRVDSSMPDRLLEVDVQHIPTRGPPDEGEHRHDGLLA